MTTRAAVFIIAAATLLIVALSTGAAIYYLLFGMMLVMLILALETVLVTLFTLRVSSASPRSQVMRGDSVAVPLLVRRASVLPVGEINLTLASPMDGGLSGTISVDLPPLKEREYRYSVTCPHRGHYTVGVTRAEVSDVFGLFSIGKPIRGSLSELDVRPRVRQAQPMMLSPGEMGPHSRIRMTEDTASPSDVRAWQDGDELKKVHWKLTLRRRELMVRTYEESAKPDTLVLMDVSPVNATRSQALTIEDALCETALGVVQAQLKEEYPVRMPLACAQPTELAGQYEADFSRFVEAMTNMTFDGPYPYEQVLMLEMRRMQRTGGVILVTSRLTAMIADIAVRMRRFDMQVMVIWLNENARDEAMELLTLMELNGIKTKRVDPWSNAS